MNAAPSLLSSHSRLFNALFLQSGPECRMRIPEVFKQQLKEWSELGQSAPAPDPAPEEESDIHSTPAGAWPSRGPKAADYCHVRLNLCFKRNNNSSAINPE